MSDNLQVGDRVRVCNKHLSSHSEALNGVGEIVKIDPEAKMAMVEYPDWIMIWRSLAILRKVVDEE